MKFLYWMELVGQTTRGEEAVSFLDSVSPPSLAIGRVILSLGLLMGLMIVVLFFIRRIRGGNSLRAGRGSRIEVLSHRYLLPKTAIYMVRVAERTLVLGVTSGQISLLTEMAEERPEAFARCLAGTSRGNQPREWTHLAVDMQPRLEGLRKRVKDLEGFVKTITRS